MNRAFSIHLRLKVLHDYIYFYKTITTAGCRKRTSLTDLAVDKIFY